MAKELANWTRKVIQSVRPWVSSDIGGTWQLVKTLNGHSEYQQSEEALRETFEMWWPKLEDKLQVIKDSAGSDYASRRSTDDKIDEGLELARQIIKVQQGGDLPEGGFEWRPPDDGQRR